MTTRAGATMGVAALLAATLSAVNAYGLTGRDTLGDLRYTVYAPDWTWQDRDVNILVVLENRGSLPKTVSLALALPPGKEGDFQFDGEKEQTVSVDPGETVRRAFVNLRPLSTAPRQVYPLEVAVSAPEGEARVAYPLRTIRGAVVSPGRWAVFLPAGLALAWCLVFAVVLRRLSPPRAWLVPGEAVRDGGEEASWTRP